MKIKKFGLADTDYVIFIKDNTLNLVRYSRSFLRNYKDSYDRRNTETTTKVDEVTRKLYWDNIKRTGLFWQEGFAIDNIKQQAEKTGLEINDCGAVGDEFIKKTIID